MLAILLAFRALNTPVNEYVRAIVKVFTRILNLWPPAFNMTRIVAGAVMQLGITGKIADNVEVAKTHILEFS